MACGICPVAQAAGFTPLAGFSGNSSFAIETAVSGFAVAASGTVVSHGTVLPGELSGAGVNATALDEANQRAEVYTVDGMLVMVAQEGSPDVELLPAGIYIVRRGNTVEKFLKK